MTATKPVYSVVGLLVNFAALAVLYLTLSAEFLAVMQIIVYCGAILMLFVFVIALLEQRRRAVLDRARIGCRESSIPAAIVVLVRRWAFSFTPPARGAGCASPRSASPTADRSEPRTFSAASPISAKRSSPCTCCRSKSRR